MEMQEEFEKKIGLRKIPKGARVTSRCIFCKQPSHGSRGVEHIIPESLGNSKHVLPVGVVCDRCNNYFAVKIEGPLLETSHFKNLRGRQRLPNKRGRVPPTWGILLGAPCEIDLHFREKEGLSIAAHHEKDVPIFTRYLQENKSGRFIIPAVFPPVDKLLLSRFLSKVAVEMLAHRLHKYEGWETQVTDHSELDLLRNYARYGSGVNYWPFFEREIYGENYLFNDGGQTLHEFDLLYTEHNELYAVICIFGTEYTINMGGPELEGYETWLKKNAYVSPLYNGKNKAMYGTIG